MAAKKRGEEGQPSNGENAARPFRPDAKKSRDRRDAVPRVHGILTNFFFVGLTRALLPRRFASPCADRAIRTRSYGSGFRIRRERPANLSKTIRNFNDTAFLRSLFFAFGFLIAPERLELNSRASVPTSAPETRGYGFVRARFQRRRPHADVDGIPFFAFVMELQQQPHGPGRPSFSNV